MRMGIIGAGGMGRAIARRAALSGAVVLLADRSTGKARQAAMLAEAGTEGAVRVSTVASALEPDMVALALDWPDGLRFAQSRASVLTGKTLVDVTVPARLDRRSSGVRALAEAAPGAHWVKAFTTVDAGSLFIGEIDRQPVDVLVASDENRAKVAVMELVDRSGLRALDAGGLDNAGTLEDLARIGREVRERLLVTEGWGFRFLPSW